MAEDILRAQLPNGLTVQLKEIHTAPLISHWVWYRVGSRYEQNGKRGISHWVEHMQFKGTPRFPPGTPDKAIARTGGSWNAFTHMDWTTYFETLPADHLALALELESDRMINSLFDPQEVEAERTVILSELAGNLNEPLFLLSNAVQKASFEQHPYRNEVIGTPEDLQNIQRDELYEHYRRYYHPANALIAIAGDFDAQETLRQIEDWYGAIPAGKPAENPTTPEPPVPEERHLAVSGPGETVYLQIAYRSPAAVDADFFSMTVLDSLLAGPTSLNMFGGGGISNKTSRLYRALIEKELAVGVSGGMQATCDPFLYDLTITLRPDSNPDEVLAAIDDEIKRLQDTPVSPQEIQRAIKQARAMFAYGSENITNQAFWLGFAEMFAEYTWFSGYLTRLAEVTPADVQRAAQRWLPPNQRVVGIFYPLNGGQV
ncbi:pitrilysin family protein [Bellilinea sp.]|jgi:zinc protease|uniref:M16 family metallopeptidase n=1 Tax=Bellilinea sp. TaxID=2838785 RepID=UPI002ADD4EE5|nr:pitrilysin family protein [Bellilinea sp.]